MDSPIITNVILGLTFPSSTCVTMAHHTAPQVDQKRFSLDFAWLRGKIRGNICCKYRRE